MSYIKDFEQQLAEKLNQNEPTESVVRWVSEKILESYKNGLAAKQRKQRQDEDPVIAE
jgi:hypothetical protein